MTDRPTKTYQQTDMRVHREVVHYSVLSNMNVDHYHATAEDNNLETLKLPLIHTHGRQQYVKQSRAK